VAIENLDRESLCGVLYVVSGAFHAAAAAQSAKSVRQTNPWLSIDIFSDCPVEEGVFDNVTPFQDGHLRSKIDFLAQSRFDRSLYLDSDTRVVDDLEPLFAVLDRFDIALAHGHKRNGSRQNVMWKEKIPEAFPQLNGGVILFRKANGVRAFLEDWQSAYHAANLKWDQVTLRELLWRSDLRLYVLPPEYNVRYAKYIDVWANDEATPKILHFASFYDEVAASSGGTKHGNLSLRSRANYVLRSVLAIFRNRR
jgi:hypothetical protein